MGVTATEVAVKAVYLSGGIYPNNKIGTEAWRETATDILEANGFATIDPCRNKLVYEYGVYTPKEITTRDHADINAADIILINGNPVGNHLSIGTWCEMERAHMLGKPIVVFSLDDRVRRHPWVLDYSAKLVDSLELALDYLVAFWR